VARDTRSNAADRSKGVSLLPRADGPDDGAEDPISSALSDGIFRPPTSRGCLKDLNGRNGGFSIPKWLIRVTDIGFTSGNS
jgi:hypothetical protein